MARRNISVRTPLTHEYEKIHKEALDLYCSMPVARYKAVAQTVGIDERTVAKWAKEEDWQALRAEREQASDEQTRKQWQWLDDTTVLQTILGRRLAALKDLGGNAPEDRLATVARAMADVHRLQTTLYKQLANKVRPE
ncbi:MAG: hypothetical protein JSS83_14415 [Cyanobacteria bacterium SZAS LIN-3]|nr:hypothetical protein [Cyanobacteria bacterium SZAS LIN-3]